MILQTKIIRRVGRCVVSVPGLTDVEAQIAIMRMIAFDHTLPGAQVVQYAKHIAREQIKGKTEKRRFEAALPSRKAVRAEMRRRADGRRSKPRHATKAASRKRARKRR